MKRAFLIPLFTVLILLCASSVLAQQNELGLFVSMANLDSTTESDPDFGDATLEFESDLGYGVSYNRYFGEQLSVEFAGQQINSDATFGFSDGPAEVTFDIGSIELTVYSAVVQWHFAGSSAIAPYVGAGVAQVSGSLELNEEFDDPDFPVGTIDLKDETTFIANAGVDFRIGDGFAIGIDGKYIPYSAEEEGFEEEAIDLNPLVIAVTAKIRF